MKKIGTIVAGALLVAASLVACTSPGAVGGLTTLSVTPGTLSPAFHPGQHDYGVICASGANDLLVEGTPANPNAVVTVSGEDPNHHVSAIEDQVITITVTNPDTTTDHYYVRCLPHDFPVFSVDQHGRNQVPGWYLLNPSINDPNHGTYAVIMDENGAVLWYKKTNIPTVDMKQLPNGNVLWQPLLGGSGFGDDPALAAEERSLDGTLVHSWQANGTITDFHDSHMLPNGNMLLLSYHKRFDVDVTELAPAVTGLWNVLDAWIQEVRPDGTVAWEWHSEDHIGLRETVAQLDGVGITPFQTVDLIHINSIEPTPSGDIIISGRHTDAIYKIRRNPGQLDDGRIVWKLSGNNPTLSVTKKLTIQNDPLNGVARQHDARLLPNGNITIFDNRSMKQGQAARAVEYAIDETNGTATLVWSKSSDTGTVSCCLGSTRRQPNGDTVIGWGGMAGPSFSAVDPTNVALFDVTQTGPGQNVGYWNYRVTPVPAGSFDRATLRNNAGGALQNGQSAGHANIAFDPDYGNN